MADLADRIPRYPRFVTPTDMAAYGETGHRAWAQYSDTLSPVAAIADDDPERPAIIAADASSLNPTAELSYRTLVDGARRIAKALRDREMDRRVAVGMLLPLLPQAFQILLGVPQVTRLCPINPFLEPAQIARILSAAQARMLIVPGPDIDAETWGKTDAIAEALDGTIEIVAVGGGPGAASFDDLLDAPNDARPAAPSRTDEVALFHTGGTTGTPKLVRHTHGMHLFHLGATAAALEMRPNDVVPAALPLFHIGGSIIFGFLPLAHGASLVIPSPAGFRDKLVIANYWRLAERYRFTLMSCVPTVLAALNQVSVGDSDISSFRLCITGGSTVPVETCKRFAERSGMPVIEGYGMTEAASYVTVHPIGAPQRFGTVGGPLPGISIEVRPMGQEADKGPLPPGEVGVVVVEGDCVTPGYIDDHHNAGVLLGPGCFNSGDLGRMGDDGVLTLVGRAKDVIIRGGHNIDPVTIEETLAAHPDVNTVAAVGQPDGYAGELPVAYVTVRQDADVDAETLRQYARAQIVERAAAPVQVTILEDMPVTGVGKIFKPQLRMDAAVQVVRRLLEPMGRNYGFEARVGARMVDHALTVDIALPPSLPQAVVREIAGKLGELPIAYQLSQD